MFCFVTYLLVFIRFKAFLIKLLPYLTLVDAVRTNVKALGFTKTGKITSIFDSPPINKLTIKFLQLQFIFFHSTMIKSRDYHPEQRESRQCPRSEKKPIFGRTGNINDDKNIKRFRMFSKVMFTVLLLTAYFTVFIITESTKEKKQSYNTLILSR